MTRKILEERTKHFHIAVIQLCNDLPRTVVGFEISKQLIRSAGSIGANYRASLRAKSKSDFIYKMQIVLEEADESHYWLEILHLSGLIQYEKVSGLLQEAYELTAIFSATEKTAKSNIKK